MVKVIICHSLTGLNIITFHGLFNISYCDYNQQEKQENNYKLYFKNLSIYLKKSECTQMLAPPPPVRFCSLFNDSPPLLKRKYFLTDPFRLLLDKNITFWKIPHIGKKGIAFK